MGTGSTSGSDGVASEERAPSKPFVDPVVAKRNLILLATLGFIINLGFGAIIPVFPLYVQELGGGAFQVGILLASFMLSRAMMSSYFGHLSDRWGRKKLIVIGTLLYAVLGILFTIPSDWYGLIFVRLFQGVASAMVWPVSKALVVDSSPPEKRGTSLSAYIVSSNTGFAIGPFLGGGVMLAGVEWLGMSAMESFKLSFYLIAILAFAALVWVAVKLQDVLGPEEIKRLNGKGNGFKLGQETKRNLNILYFNSFAHGFAFGMISPVTVLFVTSMFFDPADQQAGAIISIVMGLASLAGLLVVMPVGRYCDKNGRKKAIVLGGFVAWTCTMLMPFSPAFWVVAALLIARNPSINSHNAAVQAMQADMIPVEIRGRLMGYLEMLGNIGTVVGPIIGGALYDAFVGTDLATPFGTILGAGVPFFLSALMGFVGVAMVVIFITERWPRTCSEK